MGWAWRWPGRGREGWWQARPTSGGLVVAGKSPCVLVGARSSSDMRLMRAASRASPSMRKSPITVAIGRAGPARCHHFAQALFEGVDGSAEDQLMALGSSLLRTLLRPDVRNVEAMIMADNTNQKSLSKLHYEARPAHIIAQIEALLRQLHAKALLNVPDPLRSARLFAALFKGSDLLIIARFDEARAEDDNEIESYCRSAVAMSIAAHA